MLACQSSDDYRSGFLRLRRRRFTDESVQTGEVPAFMSCRRLRRELIELFRFGGLDWRSAPHLDHLADCRSCRDEVGLDRLLVQQLRVALAERVEGAAPSGDAWAAIVARAQEPGGGLATLLRRHVVGLSSGLRTATAVSAIGLAVVMAAAPDVNIRVPETAAGPVSAGDPTAAMRWLEAERQAAPVRERSPKAGQPTGVVSSPPGMTLNEGPIIRVSFVSAEPAPEPAADVVPGSSADAEPWAAWIALADAGTDVGADQRSAPAPTDTEPARAPAE